MLVLALRAIKYAQYKVTENASSRARRETEREFNEFIRPQLESDDLKEGAKAFIEKREPGFKGS